MPLRFDRQPPAGIYVDRAAVDRLYVDTGLAWERGGGPAIASFTVSPATLSRSRFGEYSQLTLAWSVTGASTIRLYETLADGARRLISFPRGSSGVTHRRPLQSAAYSLECTNQTGTSVAIATFEVVANAG